MSALTFFISTWLPASLVLLAIVIVQGKRKQLFRRAALSYLPRSFVSKIFDAFNSILWAQALTLAAVSQVSALQALDPLVLFVMTILAQNVLRMSVGEKLGSTQTQWKAISVGMLIFGGWLIG